MADESGLNPFIFPLQGGLVLNQSTFAMQPGMALELENFEPDTKGGYKRILGYQKWGNQEIPFTASSTEPVLMSAYYDDQVIAARGESVYRSQGGSDLLSGGISDVDTTVTVDSTSGFSDSGTLIIENEEITYTGKTTNQFTGCTRGANGTTAVAHADNTVVDQYWTEIDSGRTGANKYKFHRYNTGGTNYIIWADGANPASIYDGTTVIDVTGANAPADPNIVVGFKNHAFFAGMSSNPQELVFSAPYNFSDFSAANGAGTISVDSPITALIVFRQELYVFAEERIYKISGNTIADFVMQPVTQEIGCRVGSTVQEFAGDILFLGPDGLRSVAATQRIGDVELGTISLPVQERFDRLGNVSEFDSIVIPDKTQYRIFFTDRSNATKAQTKGIICVRKGDNYEFGETKGIQPSCTDSIISGGQTYAIHGGYDGYVYRQEQGNTFDGATIIGRYRSPDITAGDAGIRKAFQRVIINYAPEGTINADLFLRYDYESPDAPRPGAYPFDSTKVVAIYGTSVYGTATYGGQTNPLVRQPVEGSGFAVALRVVDNGVSVPYSLKGFQLEFTGAARR
jgi:hypothetical protein